MDLLYRPKPYVICILRMSIQSNVPIKLLRSILCRRKTRCLSWDRWEWTMNGLRNIPMIYCSVNLVWSAFIDIPRHGISWWIGICLAPLLQSFTVSLLSSSSWMLPNRGEVVASMQRPTFCGQFSEDGQRFFSACQGRLSPNNLSFSSLPF